MGFFKKILGGENAERKGLAALPAQVGKNLDRGADRLISRANRIKEALDRKIPANKKAALKAELNEIVTTLTAKRDALDEIMSKDEDRE